MSEDKQKYDDMMDDTGDLPSPDTQIKPDYFVNTAIFRAQKVMQNPDIKQGSANYLMFIEHIEVLVRAMKQIKDEDYDEKIKMFKQSDEYINLVHDYSKQYKLANFKLFLLLNQIWKGKPLNMRLSV